MSVDSQKYIIQNIDAVTAFDLENGALLFRAEDLKDGTMTNEQETVYATGKNGVKIGSGDRNKASRFTATNGAIVDGIIAAQVGSDVVVENIVVPDYFEVLTVEKGSATVQTTYKAAGKTGEEIKYIYSRNPDGTAGAKYAISAAAGEDTFAYDPATRTITLPTGAFADGGEIIAIYDITVKNVKHIQNVEDKFSKSVKAVFDIWAKNICTEKAYFGKIVYPKGKVSGNWELAFGDDPSVQNLEIEALSGGCSGTSKVLWDMYIFDGDDIDTGDTETSGTGGTGDTSEEIGG
ncbi:MAG: hypothetical protein NC244_07740 [Alistipes senegalensis]|nr:hypothetical protein [Alistipes senegalensis]